MAVALLVLPSCDQPEQSNAPLPVDWRVKNDRSGSCCHRTLAMAMGAQGRVDMGRWWYKTHIGAGTVASDSSGKLVWSSLHRDLNKAKIPYAYTYGEKNVDFLKWSVQNRLGCGVMVYHGAHMILLIYIDENVVGLVDNNAIDKTYWVATDRFLQHWDESGSYAVTPILKTCSLPPITPNGGTRYVQHSHSSLDVGSRYGSHHVPGFDDGFPELFRRRTFEHRNR